MEFSDYIIYLFNSAIGIGGFLAFVIMVYAGIILVRSQGEASKIGEAKKMVINSVIGLVVLLTSYILLTTINPDIINIQNISLGNTGITIPVISPVSLEIEKTKYEFEEIPLGTMVEKILIGTSSTSNTLPCYEYEHTAYDGADNIIIGNTIDKNNDGKIDEKDILLDKDNFYCIKLLNDAIEQKIKVQLSKLITQLDSLMKSGCSCRRAYYGPYRPYTSSGSIEDGGPDCYCPYGNSYCSNCGARNGCLSAPSNPFTLSSGGFKQYQYDTCGNRLAIDCKRQEIRQLMNGSKPDQICYTENYITADFFNLLNIKDAIDRLHAYKTYYNNQVKALEAAEVKMKEPYGERVTMAEMYNNIETKKSILVTKKSIEGYDVSRYCRASNCIGDVCSFNDQIRVCKKVEDQEYYTYVGDGATFYFNAKYNEDYKGESQVIDRSDNKCNIQEQDLKKEMYGGLIRIGETVDYAEAWGKEATKRIDNLEVEIQGIYSTGMEIYDFPDSCNSSNCTNTSINKYNVCVRPCCGCNGECSCASVSIRDCQVPEPTETICSIKEENGVCNKKELELYSGCSGFCGYTPVIYQVQADYWTCPYRSLYEFIKKIYQERIIDQACYEETEKETEKTLRSVNLNQVGYIQKMKQREEMLYELASVGEIKEIPEHEYDVVSTVNLFNTVFSGASYLIPDRYNDLKCDLKLNLKIGIENRFTIFNMLNDVREKLTGCVKGYSYPYKELADNVRVMSCYELANTNLVILPQFPYPDKSKTVDPVTGIATPYINCYPYNSSGLTTEEKGSCFYNINRTGVDSDPGCLLITKEYMDNYYCCQ